MTWPARYERPTVDSEIEELFTRLRALEALNGTEVPWIYVGDPVDNPTIASLLGPESPPYQDGFTNATLPKQPLRFRLVSPDDFQCVGWVAGGTIGGVVTTIPALYLPTYDQPIEGETTVGVFSGFELVVSSGQLIRLS